MDLVPLVWSRFSTTAVVAEGIARDEDVRADVSSGLKNNRNAGDIT